MHSGSLLESMVLVSLEMIYDFFIIKFRVGRDYVNPFVFSVRAMTMTTSLRLQKIDGAAVNLDCPGVEH